MSCEYLILTLFLLERQQGVLVEEKPKVQGFATRLHSSYGS